MIAHKHKQSVESCANEINSNPKKFWNLVKAASKNEGLPPEMTYQDTKGTTDAEKANMFNDFFTSVFTPNQEGLVKPDICQTQNPNLSDTTFTEDEILKQLKSIDETKSPGPDGIPSKLLKQHAESMTPSNTLLFNKSLELGAFPQIWKLANICPVYKKGNKKEITNYRPISLLPVISKLLTILSLSSIPYNMASPTTAQLTPSFS